ncbi:MULTISPECIES: hypothetical protein [Bacillus]|uniref:hypothetical protein n=1 Tax=Bacillus TaxID=1386 RepID=UPI000E54EE2A|nr:MULTISPECIES: hypothetical protein [Bacillus subtilis group]RHL12330.1 hypothetical protein DW032_18990 [Bacillus licheniformis]MCB5337085.1 hypothetical protein [Bacillus amyloliquefaciens]MCB5337389.1 hypothetical protein [Bacillus amyloliquefaciens]MCF7615420.1 hypothetical protein [Bacillus subtilis]QTG87330.1 hypothetical protein J4048_20605 [Bacillus amyloliquefaciens]
MRLTFRDKLAIFKLANTAESIRPLSADEVVLLKEIYNSCSDEEKTNIENEAVCVVEYLFRD